MQDNVSPAQFTAKVAGLHDNVQAPFTAATVSRLGLVVKALGW